MWPTGSAGKVIGARSSTRSPGPCSTGMVCFFTAWQGDTAQPEGPWPARLFSGSGQIEVDCVVQQDPAMGAWMAEVAHTTRVPPARSSLSAT